MKSHSLKAMPFAISRDDGLAIKFQLKTHQGKTLEFECPPEAVPEILARMMSALEQAAKNRAAPPKFVTEAIQVQRHEIGRIREQGAVVLTLFASEHAGVSFALDPVQAQNMSSDLAGAAATVAPVANPKSLS